MRYPYPNGKDALSSTGMREKRGLPKKTTVLQCGNTQTSSYVTAVELNQYDINVEYNSEAGAVTG